MQNKVKIKYNPVVHETLNALIDLQPKKENLETATGRALKVIFSLEEKDKTKNNPKEKDQIIREKSSQSHNSDSAKLILEKKIEEKGGEESSLEIVSEKLNVKGSVEQSQTSNDRQEQFNTVLLTYISQYTDLETRIAYLKRYSSPELLQSVEEDLRKKKREKDLEIAAVIVEEQEEMMERDDELSKLHEENNDNEIIDQDLFDEAELEKVVERFNHENDDPRKYLYKLIEEVMMKENPREINSVINLIKEFKKLTVEPDKKQVDNNKEETQHSNKLIRHLHKKYINSTPQEQKELLKQLNEIQSTLELQRNKSQNKQKNTDQQIANKNMVRAR